MSFLSGFAQGLAGSLGSKLGGKGKGFISKFLDPSDNKSFIPSVPAAIAPNSQPKNSFIDTIREGVQDMRQNVQDVRSNIRQALGLEKTMTEAAQPERVPGAMTTMDTPNTVINPAISYNKLAEQYPEAWKVAQAIAVHESGGNYKAIGPAVKGKNAYGKYQIMQQNIPSWSKEALGKSVSKDEFYKNPDLQDRIAVYKMNALLQQGYTPQDVASIWFTGRPQKGNKSRDLATGQHVSTYVNNFNKAYYGV